MALATGANSPACHSQSAKTPVSSPRKPLPASPHEDLRRRPVEEEEASGSGQQHCCQRLRRTRIGKQQHAASECRSLRCRDAVDAVHEVVEVQPPHQPDDQHGGEQWAGIHKPNHTRRNDEHVAGQADARMDFAHVVHQPQSRHQRSAKGQRHRRREALGEEGEPADDDNDERQPASGRRGHGVGTAPVGMRQHTQRRRRSRLRPGENGNSDECRDSDEHPSDLPATDRPSASGEHSAPPLRDVGSASLRLARACLRARRH